MTRTPLLAALALAGPAAAQVPYLTLATESPGDAASLGDVDGDGWPDFAIGDPRAAPGAAPRPGRVTVLSGFDGAELYRLDGDVVGDGFGEVLAAVGDADGDGRSDLAVTANGDGTVPGLFAYVKLFSGATGALLQRFDAAAPGDALGEALLGAGDVDGDGRADLAVGTPGAASHPDGFVELFSGASGASLGILAPPVAGPGFGAALAPFPDLDQDGLGELAVGQPKVDRVHVVTAGGAVLHTFAGPAGGDFGAALAAAGDTDADGTPDLLVGAPLVLFQAFTSGSAFVFSGRTLAQLHRVDALPNESNVGRRVSGYGDFDGDGRDDFLVGHPSKKAGGCCAWVVGEVLMYSGASGALLTAVGATPWRLRAVGDVDGNGAPDLLSSGLAGAGNAFAAEVLLFGLPGRFPLCTPGGTPEGCKPWLAASGAPSPTFGPELTFTAGGFPPGRRGFLFWSFRAQPAPVPFGSATLCARGPFVRLPHARPSTGPAPCGGTFAQPVTKAYMQQHGWSPGVPVYLHFYGYGPAGSSGFGLSNAIALTVWP